MLEATFFDFVVILEGFWEAKIVPKSIFSMYFLNVFFECVFAQIFEQVWPFFGSANLDFCAHSQCFRGFFAKSTFSNHFQKKLNFGSILEGPNHQKSMKKRVENLCFFKTQFFGVSLRFLAILA